MSASRILDSVCLFLCLIQLSTGYKILVIFGHPGKSHYDVFKPLFQELGERGHNITILSHVKSAGDIKNGRDISLTDTPLINFLNLKDFPGTRLQKYLEVDMISSFAQLSCIQSLESKSLQSFLKEDNQFDVILTEFFNSNCLYGLITKYKAPFIGLSSCYLMSWHSSWFGSPSNPSYIPALYMAYHAPMSFLERAENTLMHLVNLFWYKMFMERPGRQASLQYTGYEPADPTDASLLLQNTHHSLHGVRPFTPSIVEVGGIHVASTKVKPLPKDMEKWTSETTSGLIYFSLGSLIKGHTFPEDQLQSFIKVFSKLPQRILWKWENGTIKNKPDNVMLTKWAPQFDILCNPNTVLFISHGGLLGTTEAVHCGVPLLILPQFGDQKLNAEVIKANKAGLVLNLREVTEKAIAAAIHKATSAEIRRNAKNLSERFKDRIVPPLQTAVYWVEHIAKHKGGQHMRSAAIGMPFYQYFLLDVIALFTLIGLVFLFILYKIFRATLNLCLRSKTTKSKKVKRS